jgi:hypothetical protein
MINLFTKYNTFLLSGEKKLLCPLFLLVFLILSAPSLLAQPGNTISFIAQENCGITASLSYLDTDATGRHRYEDSTVDVLAQWNNTLMRWEFFDTNNSQLICFSNYQSFPNPPDDGIGNYDGLFFDVLDCPASPDFSVTGSGTQNFWATPAPTPKTPTSSAQAM